MTSRWRTALHHPTTSLVAKSAIAAGGAFWLGSYVPGELGEYRYYAALGAYSMIYPAVSDSFRQAARAMSAILLGASLAVLVQLTAWTNPLTVALVVGSGVWLGTARWFRDQSTWLPVVALFVLAVGGAQPEGYAAAYVVQILLGAVVGLVVNFVLFPPLPTYELEVSMVELRRTLVSQFRGLASALEGDGAEGDDGEGARADLRELAPARERVRRAIDQAKRARRGNPRASRATTAHHALFDLGEALQRCSTIVESMALVILERRGEVAPDRSLRDAAVALLADLGELFDSAGEGPPAEERVEKVKLRVQDLLARSDSPEAHADETRYVAGAVAVTARDCVTAFVAAQRRSGPEAAQPT